MKTIIQKTIFFCIVTFTIILLHSCKNEETILLAQINTNSEVTQITAITATSGGEIISDNGFTVTQRGVCWSTKIDPTINDSLTKDGTGAGKFTSNLRNLIPNTSYYIRAYAINKNGVSYGNTLNFTTTDGIVLIEAKLLSDTTATSIVCKTEFKTSGGLNVISKGICWSIHSIPLITDSILTNNDSIGVYSDTIKNLSPQTQYFIRAFVKTILGTTYSNELNFTTKDPFPTSGLVAWYPFNGNANDESGNGNNGIINGTVSLTTNRDNIPNSAYLFHGLAAEYINVKNVPSLQLQNSLTLSSWIYMDVGYFNPRIIDIGNYGMYVEGTSNISRSLNCGFLNGSGGGVGIGKVFGTSTITISALEWHHVVFTVNSSFIAKLYIDGQLIATNTGKAFTATYPNDLNIGRMNHPAYDAWGGKIDDVGIWNRELTQEEVTQLYNFK